MEGSEGRIATLEAQLVESGAQLDKYKAAVERAMPKLKELKAQVDEKTEALAVREAQCVKLSEDNSTLRETIAQRDQDIEEKNRALAALNEEIVALKNARVTAEQSAVPSGTNGSHLAAGSDDSNAKIMELERALADANAANESLKATSRDKLTAAVNKIKDMKADMDARAAEIQRLNAQIEELSSKNKNLSESSTGLADSGMSTELENLKSAYAAVEQKNVQLSTELEEVKTTARAKITAAIEKIRDIQAGSDGKSEEINMLRARLQELEVSRDSQEHAKNSAAAEEERELHAKLANALSECQQSLLEKAALNDRLEELLGKVGSSETQLDSYKQELFVKNNENSELVLRIQSLESQIAGICKDLEENKDIARSVMSNSIEKIKEAKTETAEKIEKLEAQASRMQDLKGLIASKNAELEAAVTRVDELEKALAEAKSLSTQHEARGSEMSQSLADKQALEEQVSSLVNEKSLLADQLQLVEASRVSLQAELESNMQLQLETQEKLDVLAKESSEKEAAWNSEIASKTEEIDVLSARLQQFESEIAAVRSEFESSELKNAELETYVRKISQLEGDMKAAYETSQQMTIELEHFRQLTQASAAEKQDLVEQIQQLTTSVGSITSERDAAEVARRALSLTRLP
jgi:chromosome segregation ATPase